MLIAYELSTHKQTKFLYWVILGCQSDQIAAASWSGNSDNQLSPNIRIFFAHKLTTLVKHATLFYLYVDVSKILYSFFFHFHINPTV